MDYLEFSGKTYLVFGVANKKSIAWHIGSTLEKLGASVIYSVRSEKRKESLNKLLNGCPVYICDVENKEAIHDLAESIARDYGKIDGIVHSIAFANYSEGFKPFHETNRNDYLQAVSISSFSLIEISNAFKGILSLDASVVAMSISSQVTAENYGYMSPIKAGLDSMVRFLAKSFSKESSIRFNTVNSGPLKTSASAGIPGYLKNYLYAEKLTLRKEALKTQEVADVCIFLLSKRSSGINGQNMVVNAGMDMNYFDQEVVEKVTELT